MTVPPDVESATLQARWLTLPVRWLNTVLVPQLCLGNAKAATGSK